MQINKHGSFYIRNGWPTKIIDAINSDNLIFSPNNELNAVDNIGVGRVMIKAMRYWSVVLGLSTEVKASAGVAHTLTSLGLYAEKYDPYFQDVGTIWLMHRELSQSKDNATAWYWAFNENTSKTFSKESFVSAFNSYLEKNGENYVISAIEKEFDCFKNTYVSDKKLDVDTILNEDTMPFFAPLKLVQYIGEGKYEMRKSSPKEIPGLIAFYSILADNAEHLENNKQIGIDHLLEDSNQIGKYMNLTYSSLLEILQQLENESRLSLVNNFGNRYIQLPEVNADSIIDEYYKSSRSC